MKYSGETLQATFSSRFSLPRGNGLSLELTLQPLRLGFYERLKRRGILSPVPPTKLSRDSAGRPIRDVNGSAITISDLNDIDYRHRLEEYHQTVAILTVYEALQADPSLSFESQPPGEAENAAAWWDFARCLVIEFETAGFTAGNLIQLCREVCRLSHLIDDHLQEAQCSFSQVPREVSG